jgi:hypothetical protein
MNTAEHNAVRELLEDALVSIAKQLIEHTGCSAFTFPAEDDNPEVRVRGATQWPLPKRN